MGKQRELLPPLLRAVSITSHEKTVDVLLINPNDPVEHVLIVRRTENAEPWLYDMKMNVLTAIDLQVTQGEA